MKTVKIQVRWAAAQPGQDRRAPGCGDHTQGSSGRPASDLGVGIVLEDGSGVAIDWVHPAGRTPPHADGSMYSHTNVRAGTRALPSVIVDTEKVFAGSGWVREAGRGKTAHGWKGVRPGVRLKTGR